VHDHGPHDRNRHNERIRAFALASDTPIPPATIEMFLDLLRATHGPKLLRVKGLVALADDPHRPVVIHGVQHVFHPPKRLPAWPDADRRSRLVFIVDDLDRAVVERLWDAFLGRPRVDAPDAAALLDNPLSLRKGD
jgi:G3E family GTPase